MPYLYRLWRTVSICGFHSAQPALLQDLSSGTSPLADRVVRANRGVNQPAWRSEHWSVLDALTPDAPGYRWMR